MRGQIVACIAILPLVFASGCAQKPLGARREIIGTWALPSTQLDTPDPQRKKNTDAERLVVRWHLPQCPQDGQLDIFVRLGDSRVVSFRCPLHSRLGLWVHQWTRKEVDASVVIAAYRVDMWARGQKIATIAHPMWCDPVQLETLGGELAP